MRLETALIHAGEPRPRVGGAIAMPVFQSSTFEFDGAGDYHDVRYIRLNNTPNHQVLHAKLASLESTEAALVAGSGMAAISATLLSLLAHGDHLIAHHTLYGGTHDLITKDLPHMGIDHTFVDADDPSAWAKALRPSTRAFYVETMTNPLLEVVDLRGVAAFCRERGIASIVDNTCATPVNFRPVEHGFELVVHSATKYLNGHSDIVAGVVAGKAARVQAAKHKLDHLGGTLDPHACFLLHRGIKTLALRVRHQSESALAIAGFLEKHPAVARVHYPGLASHRRHARAREWFRGCGGLLSFDVKGGVSVAERFLSSVTLPANAPSLGGVETLVTRPATTSHAGLSAEERARRGIGDGLVRMSVGLEATEDLVEDVGRALDAASL
jgi:cystathionine beta-lyase/cystathionine gamma-synthase